jgi:membrane-associated phospholipid phosphatase
LHINVLTRSRGTKLKRMSEPSLRTRSHFPSTVLVDRRALLLGSLGLACTVLYIAAIESTWAHRTGKATLSAPGITGEDIYNASERLLRTISVDSLLVAVSILCLIGLFRGGLPLALATGGSVLAANVTTEVLKHVVLTRSIFLEHGARIGVSDSLPSGHVTVAMSLAVGVALVVPANLRLIAMIPAMLFAISVGIATVSAAWHRPTDVMAAYFVAIFWGAIAASCLVWRRKNNSAFQKRSTSFSTRLWFARLAVTSVAVTISAGIIALIAEKTVPTWNLLTTARMSEAYFAGVGACAAAGILAMSALLYCLDGVDFAIRKTDLVSKSHSTNLS